MHHVVLDRWSRGRSFLHARDARAKIAAALVLLIAVATVRHGAHLLFAAYAILLAAGVLAARIPILPALWRAAFILPFSATFAAVSWLSGDSQRAIALLEKSYLSALAVLLVVATTPLPRLMRGLESMYAPRPLVLIAQFIYRYLFVISEQAQHMLQASRCRAPGGRTRGGFHAAAGALAVLFAQSYRRAEGIQNAMLARGFTGTFPALGHGRFQAADAVFAVFAAGCIVALRVGAGA